VLLSPGRSSPKLSVALSLASSNSGGRMMVAAQLRSATVPVFVAV
jgi:hypothetical protein